ncbi:hypothetical protein ABEB36_005489 [Hypothenemus hampei]|uniref:WKF domain-containing protein n=1 Tax=Hypothenemus hampei TaxID=57062 RepID=A0ABD1EYI8_HYPHA
MNKKDKTRKKSNGKKVKVSFDEEIVTKEHAEKLIFDNIQRNNETEEKIKFEKPKSKRKKSDEFLNCEKKQPNSKTKQKSHKKETETTPKQTGNELKHSDTTLNANNTVAEKKESNRALKRKKHAKFLEEKKLKIDIELQQKTLNYLSKWKHSRSEWKFEKLKQIWLQQNLLDNTKIPDQFWDTVVEYFCGSKGHSRQIILDDAVKVIESEENSDSDLHQTKLKRAKDIVQRLQLC